MASERLFRDDDLEYSVLSPLQLPFAQEFLTDHVTEVHENGRMNASVLPKFDEIFLVGISDDCGIGQTIPQVSLSDCTFGPKITEAMSTLISIDNYFGESEGKTRWILSFA